MTKTFTEAQVRKVIKAADLYDYERRELANQLGISLYRKLELEGYLYAGETDEDFFLSKERASGGNHKLYNEIKDAFGTLFGGTKVKLTLEEIE